MPVLAFLMDFSLYHLKESVMLMIVLLNKMQDSTGKPVTLSVFFSIKQVITLSWREDGKTVQAGQPGNRYCGEY